MEEEERGGMEESIVLLSYSILDLYCGLVFGRCGLAGDDLLCHGNAGYLPSVDDLDVYGTFEYNYYN